MKKKPITTPGEVKDMTETLIVMGTKSEQYYRNCTAEQIVREYDRLMDEAHA